jgi:hypothetical protein
MIMATASGPRSGPPLFYTMRDVQRAVGGEWSQRRIRRWLARAGALERRYGTVVTTPQLLATSFPEIYQRLIEDEDEEE